MPKLPGVNYSAPVPSLGRHDVRGPLRVANAQAAAARSIGDAIGSAADVYKGIKEEEGRSALVDAASAWRRGEAEIRTNPNIEERNEQAEELRKEIEERFTGDMHSVSAKTFKAKWSEWSQSRVDGVITDGVKEAFQIQRTTTEENALRMAREGDLSEAIGFIGESTVLNDSEKTAIGKAAKLEFSLGDLERVTNSEDPDEIAELLGGIKDPDYTGPFEDENRKAAINQLERAFDTAMASYESRVSFDREQFASDLEVRVNRGMAGPVDIMAARNEKDANGDPMITGPKQTQLLLLHDRRQSNLQTQYQQVTLVNAALLNGEPLDRKDPDDVAAVDFAYEDYVRRNGDDPQAVGEYGVTLATNLNILPNELEGDLRRLAFSGNPDAVLAMANIYKELEDGAPQVLDTIGTKERAIYKSTMAFFRGGGDLDKAVELAKENAFKNSEEKSALRQLYSIEFSPNISDAMGPFQSWLDDQNGLFDISPNPFVGAPSPVSLSHHTFAAYRSMEMEYWIHTNGNAELTRQFAREDYKRLFATSTINGSQEIMPYAPEREYGLDTGNEGMIADIQSFYVSEGISGQQPFIRSDGVTARDPLGARTYAVFTKDEFGGVVRHGRRWKMNTAAAKAIRDEISQADQDRLRRTRGKRLVGVH